MTPQSIDHQSARAHRDLTRRARRLAQNATLDDDRIKLLQYAAELETTADALGYGASFSLQSRLRWSGKVRLTPSRATPAMAARSPAASWRHPLLKTYSFRRMP